MRIAYCATVQPKFGGLRTFNLGLSQALKTELELAGHELILITNSKYKSDYEQHGENLELFTGNHIWYENVVLPTKLAALGIDAAIFPHNRLPVFNQGQYKKICIFHDLLFYRYPANFSWLKRKSREFFLKNAAQKSDYSFSVSRFTAAELNDFLPGHRSTVCLQAINQVKADKLKTAHLSDRFMITKPYFLFFGAQSFQKNLVSLIKAFDTFEHKGYDYQLVIAGGNGTAEEEVSKSFKNSIHRSDILFPGFVTEDEKALLLRNAKAFVFPSVYEGFGIPLLEAFQLGTAVICSNKSCLPEISGGAALEVDPDPISLAVGMMEIVENDVLREQLIRKGKIREREFSWQKTASIILEASGVPLRNPTKEVIQTSDPVSLKVTM